MKHKNINDLYLYWNRVRGNRAAPERSAIEPADIRHLLKDTFILKVDSPDTYSFRLAGTRICSIFGRELKEENFLNTMQGETLEAIQTLLHSTCEDSIVTTIGLIGKNQTGHSMPIEVIFLPLKLNGRTNARILGCMAPLKTPHWTGIQPIVSVQLASLRMIMPHQHKTETMRPLSCNNLDDIHEIDSVKKSQTTFANGRRIRHLTVLEGGLH